MDAHFEEVVTTRDRLRELIKPPSDLVRRNRRAIRPIILPPKPRPDHALRTMHEGLLGRHDKNRLGVLPFTARRRCKAASRTIRPLPLTRSVSLCPGMTKINPTSG